MDISGLIGIVAVSATVSVSGNVTRALSSWSATIGRLSSNPNGNVLLSHRYPCKCDSAVCVQPFRYYHSVKRIRMLN